MAPTFRLCTCIPLVLCPVFALRVIDGSRMSGKLQIELELGVTCPQGSADPVVAQIQDAASDYEGKMDSQNIIKADDPESQIKWYGGHPPQLVGYWKLLTMQAKFGPAMGDIRVEGTTDARKLVSQIWENSDDSRGGDEAMWNGKFWRGRSGSFPGWSSTFGTAHAGDATETVTATSVPFVGVNRVSTGGASFFTANPVVYGEGHGALSTALRKGWCGGKKSKGALAKAWKRLVRLPANVFLTTYSSSSTGLSHRKQVRSGSLAYMLKNGKMQYRFYGGDTTLIGEAAGALAEIVKFALVHPVPTAKPRVRFTQLMAHYVTRIAHNESKFIEDQTTVIQTFKDRLASTTTITYDLPPQGERESKQMQLLPEDVVELRYSANGWGLDAFGHEGKDKTRKVNMPAFFTYLRWIGNDLGELMREMDLSLFTGQHAEDAIRSGKLIDGENVWTKYCVNSVPLWTTLPTGALLDSAWLLDGGILATSIRSHLDGTKEVTSTTKTLQCWNRNLRAYTYYLVKDGKLLPRNSEAHLKLQKLQVALDLLYQLQAQRKSTETADAIACGGSCAPPHRTAELLQISVLDTMLGVVTFSNCKSGLDRTGIYHAVQSAVDQLHILYPQCTLDLAFTAIHFHRFVHMAISEMNSAPHVANEDRFKALLDARLNRVADVQCSHSRRNPLLWEEPTAKEDAAVHMFDIMRNAVLKNLIEVGLKVTFSSTGMAGLKYAGFTAEYATKKCLEHRSSEKNPTASCDGIGANLVLGTKGEANPMVAPFLPNWVSFEYSTSIPEEDSNATSSIAEVMPGTKQEAPRQVTVMPLVRLHGDELYIASDLADTSTSGLLNPMTGCALVQDAAHLRGS